ncbi:MAG: hypothetical protein HQ596_06685 [Candidatus Saganbacteria bacterium]|nr:hypothetical protein [Candidatus Saganbacteria bacterium]
MVMLIMAVLSVFVFLNLNPYKTVKLDAATQKVIADLKYARSSALSTAKSYMISFEADPTNIYSVYEIDGVTQTLAENPSQLGSDFVVDLNEYYDGTKISSVYFNGGSKVIFDPLGTPLDDGGAEIVDDGFVTIEYSGQTKTIQIIPDTGRIRVFDIPGGPVIVGP